MVDPIDIPSGAFESRRSILLSTTDSLSAEAVRFLRENYSQPDTFEECVAFTAYNLEEAPVPYIETLQRVGFFPWVEASHEFDEVLTQAVLARYKSCYDHLRRAIELVLVGAFFASEASKKEDAWAWVRSDRDTPQFSRALRGLLEIPSYRALDKAVNWSEKVKSFYWELSDIVHVRGMQAAFNQRQPCTLYTGGTRVPHFDGACLTRVLDSFVLCTRHCVAVLAAANPVLLVGLPVEEKFGLNPPISGFFNERQAERMFQLLDPEVRDFFLDWIAKDPDVQSVVQWFREREDLTDEELRRQSEELRREIDRHSKG